MIHCNPIKDCYLELSKYEHATRFKLHRQLLMITIATLVKEIFASLALNL
jgi:hypothetical protein